MEDEGARLNVLSTLDHGCAVCGGMAHWRLEREAKRVPLCDNCAAAVVFSDIETTGGLLRDKSARERDSILLTLWLRRSLAAA